jgi:hypothetical protein
MRDFQKRRSLRSNLILIVQRGEFAGMSKPTGIVRLHSSGGRAPITIDAPSAAQLTAIQRR